MLGTKPDKGISKWNSIQRLIRVKTKNVFQLVYIVLANTITVLELFNEAFRNSNGLDFTVLSSARLVLSSNCKM